MWLVGRVLLASLSLGRLASRGLFFSDFGVCPVSFENVDTGAFINVAYAIRDGSGSTKSRLFE